jgi:DNA-binding SARP family transcriptional activator
MLSVSLFGSLLVELVGKADSEIVDIPPRSRALLAVLALGMGRSFTRSELLQIIWGDSDRGGSSGSLNTALWRLRSAIERSTHKANEFIRSDHRGAIGLVENVVWLDVVEFQSLTSPPLAKALEFMDANDISSLNSAVGLYRADLLVDNAEQWALHERERLRRIYLNALGRLMRVSALRSDYECAIRHAQKILDIDMLREDIHRELMRYFLQNGQRAHALMQFEKCRTLLRTELAIQPMRETQELYKQIVDPAIVNNNSFVNGPAARAPTVDISTVEHVITQQPACDHIKAARHCLAVADQHLAHSFLGPEFNS